jgi:alkylation response protein AidB-like acyl-CoA dehydrogenase
VNVAARGCGVALRAFELAVRYAQQRETFGKRIADHQAVLFRLADMATKVEAAHQMMVRSARTKDSGRRNDLEAGMAKYLASEYCRDVVEDSFPHPGGYGFSTEYEIERLYREAPVIGEARPTSSPGPPGREPGAPCTAFRGTATADPPSSRQPGGPGSGANLPTRRR